MGYFIELINRKFKDIAGNTYEDIRSDYRDFLVDEDVSGPLIPSRVVIPLDGDAGPIPSSLIDLIQGWNSEVLFLFIIDQDMQLSISRILGETQGDEFINRNKALGTEILDDVIRVFEAAGITGSSQLLVGSPLTYLQQILTNADLLLMSRTYGRQSGFISGLSHMCRYLSRESPGSVLLY
jgi:hypothetical protein